MPNTMHRGTVGRKVEIHHTPNGSIYCNFMLMVNAGKDRDKKPITAFYNCTVWGNKAEQAQEYLVENKSVVVTGNADQIRFWTNDSGFMLDDKGLPKYSRYFTVANIKPVPDEFGGESIFKKKPYTKPIEELFPDDEKSEFSGDRD